MNDDNLHIDDELEDASLAKAYNEANDDIPDLWGRIANGFEKEKESMKNESEENYDDDSDVKIYQFTSTLKSSDRVRPAANFEAKEDIPKEQVEQSYIYKDENMLKSNPQVEKIEVDRVYDGINHIYDTEIQYVPANKKNKGVDKMRKGNKIKNYILAAAAALLVCVVAIPVANSKRAKKDSDGTTTESTKDVDEVAEDVESETVESEDIVADSVESSDSAQTSNSETAADKKDAVTQDTDIAANMGEEPADDAAEVTLTGEISKEADVYVLTVTKAEGSFAQGDWVILSAGTDSLDIAEGSDETFASVTIKNITDNEEYGEEGNSITKKCQYKAELVSAEK